MVQWLGFNAFAAVFVFSPSRGTEIPQALSEAKRITEETKQKNEPNRDSAA